MAGAATMNPATNKTPFRAHDSAAPEGERTYSMFLHLVGLLSMLELVGSSILSTIVTGIMWAKRKDDSPYLDDHGKEAFNFQLSLLMYAVIGAALIPVFGLGTLILGIGIPILRLVGCIRGAMAAHRGEFYRYPMCFRFIS